MPLAELEVEVEVETEAEAGLEPESIWLSSSNFQVRAPQTSTECGVAKFIGYQMKEARFWHLFGPEVVKRKRLSEF